MLVPARIEILDGVYESSRGWDVCREIACMVSAPLKPSGPCTGVSTYRYEDAFGEGEVDDVRLRSFRSENQVSSHMYLV